MGSMSPGSVARLNMPGFQRLYEPIAALSCIDVWPIGLGRRTDQSDKRTKLVFMDDGVPS